MRISTSALQQQAVIAMQQQQRELADTQLQVASGRRIVNPSDDPIGSQRLLELDSALSRLGQFRTNADLVTARLALEETALDGASDVIQRVRELVIQGANATQSDDTRRIIATEIRQIADELLNLANSKNGQGEYIFAGFKSSSKPFINGSSGITYVGDQGQREIQISESQRIQDADNGSEVFVRIPNGNGTFAVANNPANAGELVVEATSVSNPALYDGAELQVVFTAPNAYDLVDASNTVIQSGTYTEGGSLSLNGIDIALSGLPATGDTLSVSPSTKQDVCATIESIATALDASTHTTTAKALSLSALNQGLDSLDQALGRLLEVRTGVGSRLNTIDTQQSGLADLEVQLQQTTSEIRDLDYAEAITRLNLQLTGLQAAQQSFAKIQGLTLFRYL